MSLPISQSVAGLAAAKVAGSIASKVIGSVAESVGFDEVLRQGDANRSADDKPLEQIAAAIKKRLEMAGIPVNRDLEFRVSQSGQIKVDGYHDLAASIESIIANDPEIGKLAQEVWKNSGEIQFRLPGAT